LVISAHLVNATGRVQTMTYATRQRSTQRAGLLAVALIVAPTSASTALGGEILYAPFSQTGGVATAGVYSGDVWVTVSGAGQALGSDYSDAFYVLPGPGTGYSSPTRIGYWDLAVGASPINGSGSQEASNSIVGPVPAYNSSGVYSFQMDIGSAPTHLYFGVDDNILSDNAGAYTIAITELSTTVPEPATWVMLLAGFAGLGLLTRRRRRELVGWQPPMFIFDDKVRPPSWRPLSFHRAVDDGITVGSSQIASAYRAQPVHWFGFDRPHQKCAPNDSLDVGLHLDARSEPPRMIGHIYILARTGRILARTGSLRKRTRALRRRTHPGKPHSRIPVHAQARPQRCPQLQAVQLPFSASEPPNGGSTAGKT